MTALAKPRLATYIGLFFVMLYLVLATGVVPVPGHLAMTAMFFLGPAAIAGMLSIWRSTRTHERMTDDLAASMLTGIVFLVVAFALFTAMLVVQETIRAYYRELQALAQSDEVLEDLRRAFRMVDSVQLGIDIAFDVFYCLGILLIGWVMFRARIYGRALAVYGVLAAAALLAFNLWTLPKPPASAGLIDLGPATGVWWIAVIIQMLRARSRQSTESTS